jgi:hypothetical protein
MLTYPLEVKCDNTYSTFLIGKRRNLSICCFSDESFTIYINFYHKFFKVFENGNIRRLNYIVMQLLPPKV